MTSKDGNNQKGFAVVEILLAVIAVAVVTLAGYYIWHTQAQGNKANTTNASTKVKKTNASTPSTETVNYLKIPEFGIEISLDTHTKDAYYAVRKDDPSIIDLSTHALAARDPSCAATASSTAAISYYNDPYATIDNYGSMETNAQAHPGAVQSGNNYYYLTPANGLCSGDESTNALQQAIRSEFIKATIKPL